jgi:hypothetical protein
MFYKYNKIILGLYLLYHTYELIPYGDELFGDNMLFDVSDGPTYNIFPNALNYIDPTTFLYIML